MTPERLAYIVRLMAESTRDHQPLLVENEVWVGIVTELLVELARLNQEDAGVGEVG